MPVRNDSLPSHCLNRINIFDMIYCKYSDSFLHINALTLKIAGNLYVSLRVSLRFIIFHRFAMRFGMPPQSIRTFMSGLCQNRNYRVLLHVFPCSTSALFSVFPLPCRRKALSLRATIMGRTSLYSNNGFKRPPFLECHVPHS